MTMRLLSMLATLRLAASALIRPYAVVSAARDLQAGAPLQGSARLHRRQIPPATSAAHEHTGSTTCQSSAMLELSSAKLRSRRSARRRLRRGMSRRRPPRRRDQSRRIQTSARKPASQAISLTPISLRASRSSSIPATPAARHARRARHRQAGPVRAAARGSRHWSRTAPPAAQARRRRLRSTKA